MPAYLLFEAAAQTFALPATAVRQVLRMAAPAPVPGAPPALRGVLNVHGTLVPVVDVRARLGLPARPLDPDAHLVLAVVAGGLVALEVDRVLDVRDVPEGAASLPLGSDLVSGAARLADGVVLVQSLDAFAGLAARPPDGLDAGAAP